MSVRQLSNHALLSTLIGQEAARRMLVRAAGSLTNVLREAERPYTVPGRDNLPPSPVSAAVELVQRAMLEEARRYNYLDHPASVRNYLQMVMRNLEHEEFHLVLLNSQQGVIGIERLFRGTVNQTAVYPREVVKLALAANAASVIFAHNHPSATPDPSEADVRLTRMLKEALGLLDIRVLDHFVIAGSQIASFAERGLL